MRKITVCLALVAVTLAFAQSRMELLAVLGGSGKGKAVFKTRGSEAELQVEGENLRPNMVLAINVSNGKVTGRVTTNALGRFVFRRAWRSGLPAIKVGEQVNVRLVAGGALVQSGNFRSR